MYPARIRRHLSRVFQREIGQEARESLTKCSERNRKSPTGEILLKIVFSSSIRTLLTLAKNLF